MATGTLLLTPGEAATFLRVHLATVYRMIKAGQLPAVRVGRGLRLDLRALDETLSRNRISSPPSPTLQTTKARA